MSMTRNQICVEQSRWNQAANGGNWRGSNIWMPLGREADRWQFVQLKQHNAGADGVACWEIYDHFAAKVLGGSYIAVGDGAISFVGGDWGTYEFPNGDVEWDYHGNIGVRTIRLTIPADTTEVWVLGFPLSGGITGTVSASAGTVEQASLDWSLTGDFGTVSAPSIRNGLVKIWSLSSGAAGTETLDITPDASDAAKANVVGYICIKRGTAAQPDTGVFDPATLIPVMAGHRGPEASLQNATNPLYLKFGAGGTPFWWGLGHWDADNTIKAASEAETRTYDEAATAWAPAADTWVRQVAETFCRRLTGTIQCNDGAARDVGTFDEIIKITAGGIFVRARHAWNATAAAQDLRIATDGTQTGGYSGQWGLSGETFTLGRAIPTDATWTQLTPWPGASANSNAAQGISWMLGGQGLLAQFSGDGYTIEAAGGTVLSNPDGFILRSSSGFPKVYSTLVAADVDLADGDVTECWHLRQVADQGGFEQAGSRRRL